MSSHLDFPGARGAVGLFWRGFRLEADLASYLAFEAAWIYTR